MKNTILITTILAALATVAHADEASYEYPVIQHNKVVFAEERTIFNFPFDESVVLTEQKEAFLAEVREFGKKMGENPTWILRIEGHTDETATEQYNMGLAQRRIAELSAALIEGGASRSQIQGVPYGEINPLADGHSDEAWETNRRIVARLIVPE